MFTLVGIVCVINTTTDSNRYIEAEVTVAG
jgi:hypothetical protein